MSTIDGMFNTFNAKFDSGTRVHLKNVYACLTMALLSAAAGAYTHLFTNILHGGGLLFSLVGAACALGLYLTPDNGKNRSTRLAMLLGFAFFSGLGMGPLLDMALRIDPGLIPNAFVLSSTIFACFSGAALFAPDGQYLYLGGTLLTGLTSLFWLGFMNIFFQSQMLFQVYLWAGLAVFCGFVMFDTQMIIEKRRRGDTDFIAHSLDLFIDFIQIFRKVLILLMQKEERNTKKRRN